VLSNTIKQKRKEKAGKWSVPLPKVRGISEDEVFRQMRSGKRKGTIKFLFYHKDLISSIFCDSSFLIASLQQNNGKE
jgi:hypothetical protein